MSSRPPVPRVAVIGTGIAGASCARALAVAGCAVHAVDKSRGPGGRLATRRLEWLDPQGHRRTADLDHGAPAFQATSTSFQQFLASAAPPGAVSTWSPMLAAASRPMDDIGALCLPQPNMPSLCRHLLRDVATSFSFAAGRLQRSSLGWQVAAMGSTLPGYFDAVLLALPPAQAATLLAAHRRDWAQRASLALMQPCWTLMGVARRPARDLHWDATRPEQGPLAWIMRNDARPGRLTAVDEVHWVAHARAGWSRQHLEQPPHWVQAQLQTALQAELGEPAEWLHAVVHRWRYAMPLAAGAALATPCWWDAHLGLGVCGDFLGGTGVEGAWLSAQALAEAVLHAGAQAPMPRPGVAIDRAPQEAAA